MSVEKAGLHRRRSPANRRQCSGLVLELVAPLGHRHVAPILVRIGVRFGLDGLLRGRDGLDGLLLRLVRRSRLRSVALDRACPGGCRALAAVLATARASARSLPGGRYPVLRGLLALRSLVALAVPPELVGGKVNPNGTLRFGRLLGRGLCFVLDLVLVRGRAGNLGLRRAGRLLAL